MEFEDEIYYYTLFDKLLEKSITNLNKSEVKKLLYNYDGLIDLKFQPTFISKTEIRERKLNTLFEK